MDRVHGGIAIGVFILAGSFAGCGGGTPGELPADQKAPDYGQKSSKQMADMYGVPGKKGQMTKPAPAK